MDSEQEKEGLGHFEEKEKYRIPLQNLKNRTQNFNRGDVLSWDDAAELTGFIVGSHELSHVTRRWRKWLQEERGIVTRCIKGVGVKLLTHKEAADESTTGRLKRVTGQYRRGRKERTTVKVSELSDMEAVRLARIGHFMDDAEKAARKTHRFHKTEPLPRRPLPPDIEHPSG